jgi:acyl dehydratase
MCSCGKRDCESAQHDISAGAGDAAAVRFEEFVVGSEFVSPPRLVSRDEIIEFASRYDQQPMHLDAGAARQGIYDDVIGSGFMSIALAWSLWLDTGAQGEDGRGGVALEECRWFLPLLPDTWVHAHVTIRVKRVSSSGHGLVTYELSLRNAAEDVLVSFRTVGIMARSEADQADVDAG